MLKSTHMIANNITQGRPSVAIPVLKCAVRVTNACASAVGLEAGWKRALGKLQQALLGPSACQNACSLVFP